MQEMIDLCIASNHSRGVGDVAWISRWQICAFWLDFYHKDAFSTSLLGVKFDQNSHGLALIETSLEGELGGNCIVKKWEVK